MKTMLSICIAIAGLAGSAVASELEADDFFVNCVSDVNGSAVTLVRSGGSDKGFLMTDNIQGEAQIIPGVGSMTFLYMQEAEVVTFVVGFEELSYDMSVMGEHAGTDSGKCEMG